MTLLAVVAACWNPARRDVHTGPLLLLREE
jgi:hypothetical protein